jgi:hypothetical protein
MVAMPDSQSIDFVIHLVTHVPQLGAAVKPLRVVFCSLVMENLFERQNDSDHWRDWIRR